VVGPHTGILGSTEEGAVRIRAPYFQARIGRTALSRSTMSPMRAGFSISQSKSKNKKNNASMPASQAEKIKPQAEAP
jgi:hypothetical protein